MAIKIPEAVRPAADFAVQVAVGAFMFAVVALIAVALAGMVKLLEKLGWVPEWLINGLHWAEWGIFCLDMFCFALFLATEAIKLIVGVWKEWRS